MQFIFTPFSMILHRNEIKDKAWQKSISIISMLQSQRICIGDLSLHFICSKKTKLTTLQDKVAFCIMGIFSSNPSQPCRNYSEGTIVLTTSTQVKIILSSKIALCKINAFVAEYILYHQLFIKYECRKAIAMSTEFKKAQRFSERLRRFQIAFSCYKASSSDNS